MKNAIRKELRETLVEIKAVTKQAEKLNAHFEKINEKLDQYSNAELEWMEEHFGDSYEFDDLDSGLNTLLADIQDVMEDREDEDVVVRDKRGKLRILPRSKVRGQEILGPLETDD